MRVTSKKGSFWPICLVLQNLASLWLPLCVKSDLGPGSRFFYMNPLTNGRGLMLYLRVLLIPLWGSTDQDLAIFQGIDACKSTNTKSTNTYVLELPEFNLTYQRLGHNH